MKIIGFYTINYNYIVQNPKVKTGERVEKNHRKPSRGTRMEVYLSLRILEKKVIEFLALLKIVSTNRPPKDTH